MAGRQQCGRAGDSSRADGLMMGRTEGWLSEEGLRRNEGTVGLAVWFGGPDSGLASNTKQ